MSTDVKPNTRNDEVLARLKALPRYRNSALKSLWRRLAFFGTVLRVRLLRRKEPLFVVLVTNNRCNLSCRYCYGKYGERRGYVDFTTREIVDIVDRLWNMGTRYLTVHGGESLLRSDIGPLLNYMKHKGFYVSLNTNGVLVPQKLDELRCVDTICVSLDGAEEANDRNRGAGSYRMAMAAIEAARAANIPLAVSATLTRHNVGDMEFLARLAQQRRFRLQYSILYNAGRLGEDEVLTDKEIREVAGRILALKRDGYPVYYSKRALTAVLAWPFPIDARPLVPDDERNTEAVRSYRDAVECYHGALKYQIDADGRVVTCWGHDDADAPNIRELGVEEAIRRCAERKDCAYCAFMANIEHNLMFGLDGRTILDLVGIQLRDAFKIRRGRA